MSAIEQTEPMPAMPVQKRSQEDIRSPGLMPADKPARPAIPLAPQPPRRGLRRIIVFVVVLGMIALGLITAVGYWLDSRQYEWTDDAAIDGHLIAISPQVAARVLEVEVNDNQSVKAGDVLVKLDAADFQAALDQKKAVEDSARGHVEEARSRMSVSQANVGEANAALAVQLANSANAEQDLQRFSNLDPRARSQQQLDNATMSQRSASAMVLEAKAKVTAMQAQVISDQAAMKTAQSDLAKAIADTHEAQIELGYCTITSPVDGVITRKSMEPGMYLMVGQPLFSIVPSDVWVTANFKETQLDLMRPGQDVALTVDAYPEKKFHGVVQSIQRGTGSKFTLMPPENATGNFVKVVQRVPVKIVFDADELKDADHPLAPGMSVTPRVKVRPYESLRQVFGMDAPAPTTTPAAGQP